MSWGDCCSPSEMIITLWCWACSWEGKSRGKGAGWIPEDTEKGWVLSPSVQTHRNLEAVCSLPDPVELGCRDLSHTGLLQCHLLKQETEKRKLSSCLVWHPSWLTSSAVADLHSHTICRATYKINGKKSERESRKNTDKCTIAEHSARALPDAVGLFFFSSTTHRCTGKI